MGGSKSTSGSAQKWARPIAQAAANQATGIFNANQPGLNNITSTVQGLIPGLLDKYNQGNPTLTAAQDYAGDVLGGKYLTGNPYMSGMIDQTARDVTGRVGGAFGSRGTFGGSQWATGLSRSLADAENALRYGDYSAERANQQAAMGAAPQLAAADYLGITPLLSAAESGAQLPYTGLNAYTGALGTLFNGGVQKQSGIGSVLQGVGSIGSAAGSIMAASDVRVKKDIAKVDEMEDGLGVYDFRYVWDDDNSPLRRGVMAQEVEQLRPWALGPVVSGIMTVNYGAL